MVVIATLVSLCANPFSLGPTLAIVYPQLVDSFFVEKFSTSPKWQKTYTVEDFIQFLDDNFDLEGDGFEYDIKDVDYDEFESLEPYLTGSVHKTTVNTFQYQTLVIEDEVSERDSKMYIDFDDSPIEFQRNVHL